MKWERKDIKSFWGPDQSQWLCDIPWDDQFIYGSPRGHIQVSEIRFTARDLMKGQIVVAGRRLTPIQRRYAEPKSYTVPMLDGVGRIPVEILKEVLEQAGRLMIAYEKAERTAAAVENGDHLKAVE